MPKYRVIAEFIDLEAGLRRIPGDTVEVSLERAKVLIEKGVVYPAPLEETQKAEEPGKEDSETADEKPGKSKRK